MKEKEPFYQVPKSLFRLWRDGVINSTAFSIYMLMLDRYKVSCLEENKKNFTDENGEIFFVYAYNSLAEDLKISKRNGITKGIQDLESLGLIKSKKVHGKATIYYLTSNPKDTTTSNPKDTTTSNPKDTTTSNPKDTLIIINNKNNINKNNINNNNKENVAAIIRQEIKFLIKTRNIKIDNVLKYCSDLNRIKEVFLYADKNNKSDGWVIACLRDNYSLKQEENQEKEKEKDYSKTMDEILRGG